MADINNVFISHIHEDDDDLKMMKDLLQKNGFEIRDSSINSSKPNEASSDEYIKSGILAPRIQWAGTIVVLISPGTRDSEWVTWEIEYAQRQGKRIVGIWAHGAADCDIPQALDKFADAVVGWQAERINDAICGKLNNWETSSGDIRPPREIARYSCA
jgi:hypothetical protein